MIENLKMTINKLHTPFQITKTLNAKYTISYSFFTVKNINQLIYSVGNSLCIRFDHLKDFHDDVEYLRRTYRQHGPNGKNQIQDRIILVAKYYESEKIGSHVPMIIEADTNDIFMRRAKRLRRLKEQSQKSRSETSSSFGSGSLSFSFQEDFLKDINLQYSELMNDQSSQLLNGLQFSEQDYNIFEDNRQNYKKINTLGRVQKLDLKQNTIEHLVCDFREIDVESVLNFYKDIKKSKNGSIILSEILEEEQKFSKKASQSEQNKTQKISKLSSQNILQRTKKSSLIPKDTLLSTYVSIFGQKSKSKQSKQSQKFLLKPNPYLSHAPADEYVQEYKKLWNTIQNAEEQIGKEKTDLISNRTKVRQKAEQLLKTIKMAQ